LANTTEKLCGYKPDSEIVKNFLSKISEIPKINDENIPTTPQRISRRISDNYYTNKSIVAFTFKGKTYSVRSWIDMLITVINIMLSTHGDKFEIVLKLAGTKRPYFSKNSNELRIPRKINNTDIYVETNLSSNSIVKISKLIIGRLGDNPDDLSIEVK
jgi:GTPase SAR1 family protein